MRVILCRSLCYRNNNRYNMAGYFDRVDHEVFSRYIVANKRIFDEIEAQHIANKAVGAHTG